MAAAPNRCVPELITLTRLRPADLDALLLEEQLTWRSALNWEFDVQADLIRRYLAIHSLAGYALAAGSQIVGYCYYVTEEHKGIIGDLYIRRDWASPENEDLLLSAVLNELVVMPGMKRIEAQLMLLHGPSERTMPLGSYGSVFPRMLMRAEVADAAKLPMIASEVRFEAWRAGAEDEAARVIAAAYREHVDSRINDQYRSVAGGRKFLYNLVHYPGCGTFLWRASLTAHDHNRRMAGVVLSSLVASDVGHITQVCVSPEWVGRGLGYELMRRALLAIGEEGCERVSLTVTTANRTAVKLYENLGFRGIRRFAAYVWEGF
jgi:ribosomal protein S18 acetylase RimI-like enzyme